MRIVFDTMDHPLMVVMALVPEVDLTLAQAKQVCARIYGYDSWAELSLVTDNRTNQPSLPDEMCSQVVRRSRYLFQLREAIIAFRKINPIFYQDKVVTEILNKLAPTYGFIPGQCKIIAVTELLFPSKATMQVTSSRLLDLEMVQKLQPPIVEIGSAKTLPTFLARQVAFIPLHDPKLGLRVFHVEHAQSDADGNTNIGIAIIFKVRVIVEENIITTVEVSLLDGYMQHQEHLNIAEFLESVVDEDAEDERDYQLYANCFLSYFKQINNLNLDLGELSLPFDGVKFVLVNNAGYGALDEFTDALSDELREALEYSYANKYGYDNPPINSGKFPIPNYLRIVDWSYSDEITDCNNLDDRIYDFDAFNPRSPDNSSLHVIPALVCYLEKAHKKDLAEFAAVHNLSSVEAIKHFIKFVSSLNSSHVLTENQFMFICHLSISAAINLIQAQLSPDELHELHRHDLLHNRLDQHIEAAELLGTELMKTKYSTQEREFITNQINNGCHELDYLLSVLSFNLKESDTN